MVHGVDESTVVVVPFVFYANVGNDEMMGGRDAGFDATAPAVRCLVLRVAQLAGGLSVVVHLHRGRLVTDFGLRPLVVFLLENYCCDDEVRLKMCVCVLCALLERLSLAGVWGDICDVGC